MDSIILIQLLHQQPNQSGQHPRKTRQHQRGALCLTYLKRRLGNVVVNMTGLEQLHQRKRDDEPDRGPFEASQKQIKHPRRF